MFNHILTFAIFLVIGLEIREGLSHPKSAILPSLAALGGMVIPAAIYLAIASNTAPWAVVMPTDVALAVGALALLGNRISPSVKIFLLTLAVADDFFSLAIIGIFYRNNLDLQSALYTLGAAAIGTLLPFRAIALKYLAPLSTFIVIPAYIWINLISVIDLSNVNSRTALSITVARVLGKVIGIAGVTYLLIHFTSLQLPREVDMKEIVGIGLLSGMGMTVSLVIADIAIDNEAVIGEIRSGLVLAALISGLLGLLWLKRFPASL